MSEKWVGILFAIVVFVSFGIGLSYLILMMTASGKIDYCYLDTTRNTGKLTLVLHRKYVSDGLIEVPSIHDGLELAKQLDCPISDK